MRVPRRARVSVDEGVGRTPDHDVAATTSSRNLRPALRSLSETDFLTLQQNPVSVNNALTQSGIQSERTWNRQEWEIGNRMDFR